MMGYQLEQLSLISSGSEVGIQWPMHKQPELHAGGGGGGTGRIHSRDDVCAFPCKMSSEGMLDGSNYAWL